MPKFSDDSVNVSAHDSSTSLQVLESQQEIRKKQIRDIQSLFDATWNELAVGNASGLALYHVEILNFVFQCLDSHSWFHKRLSAATITRLFQNAPTDSFSISIIDQTLDRLIHQLEGKLWIGKESFLQSISSVLNKSSHSHYFSHPDSLFHFEHVVFLLVQQLQRPKIEFRHFVLRSLFSILNNRLDASFNNNNKSMKDEDRDREEDQESDEMAKLIETIEAEINKVLADCFAITNAQQAKDSKTTLFDTSREAWKKKALCC